MKKCRTRKLKGEGGGQHCWSERPFLWPISWVQLRALRGPDFSMLFDATCYLVAILHSCAEQAHYGDGQRFSTTPGNMHAYSGSAKPQRH